MELFVIPDYRERFL